MSSSSKSSSRQAKIDAAAPSTGPSKIMIAAVVVIVAILATVGGVIWMDQQRQSTLSAGGTATPAGVGMGNGYPVYTDVTPVEGAPTVDIYEDFQCPACGRFEQILGPTIGQMAADGEIQVRYHVMNFLDDTLRNDSSTRGAVAAFCAADDGKFVEYHDALYANQPATEGTGWTDEQLAGFASDIGVTGDALDTWTDCVEADTYSGYVNSIEESSAAAGVRGTPTVAVNGEIVQLPGPSVEAFTAAIDNATS